MIIKKEKTGDVSVYYVDKVIPDYKMHLLKNTYMKPSQINFTIESNADVYTNDGILLVRFRKNKLNKKKIDDFYDAVIDFAKQTTSNRGSTSGSKQKNVGDNPKIMTNIFGYFDRFSPSQKAVLTKRGMGDLLQVRQTRFNMDFPDNYKKTIPLIKEIDNYYAQLVPQQYKLQHKKANQTPFKISDTSFTTVTTNVNFRTTIHKDKGDDEEGFGNLAVIERGEYEGGETCFPQYGVAINVRMGDVLFMNVHEWHGNLPIKKIDNDAIRLSIVCYLRHKLWERTKHKTKKFMIEHNNIVRSLRQNPTKTKTTKTKTKNNKTKKNKSKKNKFSV